MVEKKDMTGWGTTEGRTADPMFGSWATVSQGRQPAREGQPRRVEPRKGHDGINRMVTLPAVSARDRGPLSVVLTASDGEGGAAVAYMSPERAEKLAEELLMAARGVRLLGSPTPICSKPPPGWVCSRGVDHDGPCAASPVGEPER